MDEPRQILQTLRNLQAIVDVLSWIASRFDKAIDQVERQPAIDDVLRELSDYLTGSIDRTDRLLLLILERLPERKNEPEHIRTQTAELKRETIENRLISLRLQRKQYTANLNWLEEQAATYGAAVTVEIRNQIQWTKDKLAKIDNDIGDLQRENN